MPHEREPKDARSAPSSAAPATEAGAPVALVTGATSGIGLETARLLASQGYRLFLVGRDPARLEPLAAELRAVPLRADLAEAGAAERVAAAVAASAGRLDLLVNSAGRLEIGRTEHLGAAVAEQVMRLNFLGTVALLHACLPLLRRAPRPSVIILSSMAGRVAPPYMAAYAASKFALNAYVYSLRQELHREGIHIGLVMPGPVDTPMIRGRVYTEHYRLPPFVPVISAERVAAAIWRMVQRRTAELIIPRRLSPGLWFASAFPRLVDWAWRLFRSRRSAARS